MTPDEASAVLKRAYAHRLVPEETPTASQPDWPLEALPYEMGRPLTTPLFIPRRRRCATADPNWRPRR